MSQSAHTAYAPELWLKNYRAGHGAHLNAPPMTVLELFDAARCAGEDRPALIYFDRTLSYRQLDEMSDSLAAYLVDNGFVARSRLALYLQNMPQFVIAVLAAWKVGGVVVPINPMNQEREVNAILVDCRPHTLICLDYLFDTIVSRDEEVRRQGILVLSTSAHYLQTRNDRRILPDSMLSERTRDCADLSRILEAHQISPARARVLPDDLAFLVYTSGTTGVPKAALITHGNVSYNARNIATWYDFQSNAGPVLAIAPLFHVTGLVGHMALSWVLSAPLILMFRFDAAVVIDAIRANRPAFTVGAITAYNALIHHPGATSDLFDSFHVLVSGGAAIAPSVVEEIRSKTRRYVHNGYGLTESSAGVICTSRSAPRLRSIRRAVRYRLAFQRSMSMPGSPTMPASRSRWVSPVKSSLAVPPLRGAIGTSPRNRPPACVPTVSEPATSDLSIRTAGFT